MIGTHILSVCNNDMSALKMTNGRARRPSDRNCTALSRDQIRCSQKAQGRECQGPCLYNSFSSIQSFLARGTAVLCSFSLKFDSHTPYKVECAIRF